MLPIHPSSFRLHPSFHAASQSAVSSTSIAGCRPGRSSAYQASSTACHWPGRRTAINASRTSSDSRVQPRVFDAEFPHLPAADLRAVNLLRQPIMLGDHVPLLEQTRRIGQRQARRQRPHLLEDPRIADRAAGDRHAIDARCRGSCRGRPAA